VRFKFIAFPRRERADGTRERECVRFNIFRLQPYRKTLFNQKFLSGGVGGAIMNSCKSVSVKEKGGGLSLQKVCLMTKSNKTLPPRQPDVENGVFGDLICY